MQKILLIALSLMLTGSLFAMAKKQPHKIDDWDYNTTRPMLKKMSRLMPTAMASPMMKSAGIGYAVGGAKDADNFYENLKRGFLPKLDSITYEGVFYDHYFTPSSSPECKMLFCPSYEMMQEKDPFTQEEEYFLSVGLDSNIQEKDFRRKKLNIVVVLDISGSMGASFDQYYYDKNRKVILPEKERTKSKMALANQAIVDMIGHLKAEDSLGIVLFDEQAYEAKPLRPLAKTDIQATKKHILELRERGGTNWAVGYKKGISLFKTLTEKEKDPNYYENRIIFLTDAMPNRGELNEKGLFGIAKEAAQNHIYTTFIGIGVDFNNDLVEAVSKTKGANYYAIHSAKAFKKRLDEEFDYMVTPLVFDLTFTLKSDAFKIAQVYGSPDADKATGRVIYINTLFPTPNSNDGSRGNMILIKLTKRNEGEKITLDVSYHDRENKPYHSQKSFSYHPSKNQRMQKAILLTRYVDVMKNFLADMRRDCHDQPKEAPFYTQKNRPSSSPTLQVHYPQTSPWERASCPLHVSAGYHKIFALLSSYFKTNMDYIQDKSLNKEFDTINMLRNYHDNHPIYKGKE